MGVSGLSLTPSQAWEPWKHGSANLLPPPQACVYVPAFSAAPASSSWSPMSYWGVFPPLLGEPGWRLGFLDFRVSPDMRHWLLLGQ